MLAYSHDPPESEPGHQGLGVLLATVKMSWLVGKSKKAALC